MPLNIPIKCTHGYIRYSFKLLICSVVHWRDITWGWMVLTSVTEIFCAHNNNNNICRLCFSGIDLGYILNVYGMFFYCGEVWFYNFLKIRSFVYSTRNCIGLKWDGKGLWGSHEIGCEPWIPVGPTEQGLFTDKTLYMIPNVRKGTKVRKNIRTCYRLKWSELHTTKVS